MEHKYFWGIGIDRVAGSFGAASYTRHAMAWPSLDQSLGVACDTAGPPMPAKLLNERYIYCY